MFIHACTYIYTHWLVALLASLAPRSVAAKVPTNQRNIEKAYKSPRAQGSTVPWQMLKCPHILTCMYVYKHIVHIHARKNICIELKLLPRVQKLDMYVFLRHVFSKTTHTTHVCTCAADMITVCKSFV
jgi:hypothetical protein